MDKSISFEEFQKELTRNSIRHTVTGPWAITLPNSTRQSTVQKLIDLSRKHLLTSWHIKYQDITEEVPGPDILVWWDVI